MLDTVIDMFFAGDFGVVAVAYRFTILFRAILGDAGRGENGAYRQQVKSIRRIALLAALAVGNCRRVRLNALYDVFHVLALRCFQSS